jgi:NAD(P)-dependent dehydrogenase (short-subunit alcohol dehydrogenase family)
METKSIALITGVSRAMGLGYETARQLAQKGYLVIITARDESVAQNLANQLNQENLTVIARALDITRSESVQNLVESIQQDFGRLDVLINNAGAFFDAGGSLLTTDISFALEAFETNLLGILRVIQGFIDLLRLSQHPRIVNVSSGAGSFTDPVFGLSNHPQNVPIYGITKLALNGLTVKLAKELQSEKILINAVCPGWVATYPGTAEWGARPVSEGAKGIVWAATLPDDAVNGGFFRDGEPLSW